jgi:elongation factor P
LSKTSKSQTPSARGAASIYRFRYRNLVTKGKQDVSCKGDEAFPTSTSRSARSSSCTRRTDLYTFMDAEDFSQFSLPQDAIEEQILYLVEDMEGIFALVSDARC